jgi:hypothetical protein
LIGLCNFVVVRRLRAIGIQNAMLGGFSDSLLRGAVIFGILVTLVGGIAHRTADFNPNFGSSVNWVLAICLPLFIAFLLPKSKDDMSAAVRAQTMERRAMLALQQCVHRFPEVFTTPPWNWGAPTFASAPSRRHGLLARRI